MIEYVDGNLFEIEADAIGHGVNCKGVMGSGIALEFRERYPRMYDTYKNLCHKAYFSPGQVFVWRDKYSKAPHVYNIASQDFPGANADYSFLEMGLQFVRFDAERVGYETVALPQIGAGIGGLQWNTVKAIMRFHFEDSKTNFKIVTYKP